MPVSFIILTYNSAKTVKKCLESVLKQKCKKEIMVVDGCSTDKSVEIVKKIKGVHILLAKKDGIAPARNMGLKAARGDYIAFVDSDVVLPPGWCKKAISLLERDEKIAGVGGPGISPEKGAVTESLNMLLFGKTPAEEREVRSIATMDAMYKREAVAGHVFDETLETGEDPEFNLRLIKRGYKLLFSEKLRVWHHHPVSLGGLVKKWYNYGKNYPIMCSRHREFKSKEYYVRISYMPLLIAFLLLSLYEINFAFLAFLQVFSLYLIYFVKGLKIGAGLKTPVFSGIHTLKQLAQLAGNLVGLKKVMR